jgi:hypothetical protein
MLDKFLWNDSCGTQWYCLYPVSIPHSDYYNMLFLLFITKFLLQIVRSQGGNTFLHIKICLI